MQTQKIARLSLACAAVVLATAVFGSSTAWAQTPPTPTDTFQPAGAGGAFGTAANWLSGTVPGAGSQVLIAAGKTGTMSQANADTLFGSLTLGVSSTISLAATDNQGPATNSVLYFNNGSELVYTSGDTNRNNTYNIVSGAAVRMQLSGITSGDSLPSGSLVGDSSTTVDFRVNNTTNVRWNNASFSGVLNYLAIGTASRSVNFGATGAAAITIGPGTTNFGDYINSAVTSNRIDSAATIRLTGRSGGASTAKLTLSADETISNLVIDSPIGATGTSPTFRTGGNVLTVSGSTTFQGTAGNVNFDSTNATPSSHILISTANMTFGGTGTWAVSGDGVIRLNAASGTRTITTNTTASIANTLSGTQGFTKAGAATLTLSGSNTYTGTTTISAGVLNIQNANALGTTAGGVTVSSSAALEIQGGITVGAEALSLVGTGISSGGALRNISGTNTYGGLVTLTGAARINSDAGSLILSNTGTITGSGFDLTLGGAGNTTISSIIGTGSGTLTKEGAGTVTLTGASTYTGNTTVSAGRLAVNGSLGSGTVSVAAAAWLQGSGTIAGAVNVSGTLSPGNSPGIFTFGSLVLDGTSTTLIEVNGLVRGTDYDGVNITGTSSSLTYGGLLSLNFGSLSPDSVTYDIFDFAGGYLGGYTTVTSTGAYIGTWADIGGGQFRLVAGAQTLTFDQATGDIIVVPEPATIAFLGSAVGLIGLRLARRRKA
jgi:fibronectin-binding autotransporter adhesin